MDITPKIEELQQDLKRTEARASELTQELNSIQIHLQRLIGAISILQEIQNNSQNGVEENGNNASDPA